MAVFSVEAISEITSVNPKSCRIKRATFTCYFCNTAMEDDNISGQLSMDDLMEDNNV